MLSPLFIFERMRVKLQKPLSRLEKFIYALCSLDSSELPEELL